MSFQSSSTLVRVGLFMCVLAFLATCTAFFSSYWLTNDSLKVQLGLWYSCISGVCSSGSTETQSWQEAMFAMGVLGLLAAIPCILFAIFYVFVPRTSGKRWVKITSVVLAVTAGGFLLAGGIICAAKKHDFPEVYPGVRPTFDLGWSFAVAVVAGLLYMVVGFLFALDSVCN